jgi:PAS domain S-box-containing protein
MGKEIFDSITSKLATQVPLFAKALVTQGLEYVGTTPYSVTPFLMKKALDEYILPRLYTYGKGATPIDAIGEGIIRTDANGNILEISPVLLNLLGLKERGKVSSQHNRETLIEFGILHPPSERWDPGRKCISQKVELPPPNIRTIEVLITPILNPENEIKEFHYLVRDITLSDGLLREIFDLYENQEKKIQQGTRHLHETEHLGNFLVQELDRQRVLNLITEKTAHLVGAETVFVTMILPGGKAYSYPAAYGEDADLIVGGELPMETGLCGWVLKHKRPLLVSDLAKDKRAVVGGVLKDKFKSAMYLPLFNQGKIIGGLTALSEERDSKFSEQDLKLLSIFANHASIAIENASLYSDLKQNRDFLETIINNVGVGIIVLDRELKVISVNKTFSSITDKDQAEFIGTQCYESIHGRKAPCKNCHVLKTFSTGRPIQRTEKWKKKNGEDVHVDINSYPIFSSDGEVIQSIETINDITEFKKMEAERIAQTEELQKLSQELEQKVKDRTGELDLKNKELKEANRMLRDLDIKKTDFLNIVAHDLRTPLTSITSYADLLLRYKDEPQETQNEFLTIIKTEGLRLGNLINDYLDLSKIEAGLLDFKEETLDLNKLIVHCKSLFEGQGKIMEIHLDFDSEEMILVQGDRERLIQALINLLSNAFKFTPRGGRIAIQYQRCSKEDLETLPLPDHTPPLSEMVEMVMVRLTDTGPGIPEEHHRDIFEKFKQIRTSSNKDLRGTGLGLPIAKNIIERHGGRLWVESRPGDGTTFAILLPVLCKPSYNLQ